MVFFDEDDDNETKRKRLIFPKENEENKRNLCWLFQSTLALIIVVWKNSYKTSIFAHKSHDVIYTQSFLLTFNYVLT